MILIILSDCIKIIKINYISLYYIIILILLNKYIKLNQNNLIRR